MRMEVVDPADREIARSASSGLVVRIGPASYDRNDRIKIADPFTDWQDGTAVDAEWVVELRRSEVHELVRMLMTALEEL